MEEVDHINLLRLGGSLFARVSSPICKVMGLEKGTGMKVYRDGDRIIFEREEK